MNYNIIDYWYFLYHELNIFYEFIWYFKFHTLVMCYFLNTLFLKLFWCISTEFKANGFRDLINIYYHWFVLREWISLSNVASTEKPELWDAVRSLLRAKRMNDSMFFDDLWRPCQWCQYKWILLHVEINNMFLSIIYIKKDSVFLYTQKYQACYKHFITDF